MFVNVWACRTPFAPEPYCCLDSYWLRKVWESTSAELQGGHPLILPIPTPCLSGVQPGLTVPHLFARQKEAHLLSPLSVFLGQILKLLTCHLDCAPAAYSTQPCVCQSLCLTYGETCTSSKAVYLLQLTPLDVYTPTRVLTLK